MLNSYKFCFQKFCAFSVYYFLCTLLMIHIYIYILLHKYFHIIKGFPDGTGGKEPACHCKRPEVQFWSLSQKDLEKRARQPAPVFLHGESHGQRKHSSQGRRVDMTEATWLVCMQYKMPPICRTVLPTELYF